MKIAVIGSNMVDLVSYIQRMPEKGETLEANDFKIGCGGKGANQAVAAARLGSEILMLSRVGNDMFAENTIRNFEKNGIDSRYILKTEASSGVAPIFVDPQSQNAILIIKGANNFLSPQDIDNAYEDLKQCELIVLQLEIPLETVYAAIDFGKENNIPVLLNPAPAHPDICLEKITSCDFIVPNESELALLTGLPVETEDEIKFAARSLRQRAVKQVIVTMGSRGVLWININDEMQYFAPHKVNAKDTTGAGDAFIGCFSHVYTQTKNIALAIEIANNYAADSVTRFGTQSSYADKATFLSMYPQFKDLF